MLRTHLWALCALAIVSAHLGAVAEARGDEAAAVIGEVDAAVQNAANGRDLRRRSRRRRKNEVVVEESEEIDPSIECDMGCLNYFVGDGECDMDCLTDACRQDAGDCTGKVCNGGTCLMSWIGDGVCDEECNTSDCGMDGGDCKQEFCAPGCQKGYIGDGYCDHACNNEACEHDGGDCAAPASD